MGLVEGVVRERDQDLPQGVDSRIAVSLGAHPLLERSELLLQDLLLLLAHRATQEVGFTERVTGQLLRDGHDLLLVDDQSIRVTENLRQGLCQFRVNGNDRLPAVLSIRVVVVCIGTHGSGSVEGQDSGNIFEAVRLHGAQE